MNDKPRITRIDHDDPFSKAALDAERRLFAHYGLDYKVHFVEMEEPNLRVRVLEVGQGRPLLMVTGGTGDAWYYADLMAQLKGWRMIVINRPGGGLSDGIDFRQVNLRQLAVDTLRSVADAFELDRVPIVCNSMGGLWSIWYALAYPQRVSKMAHMGCPALILDTSAPFFMRLLGVPGINRLIAPMLQPKDIDNALNFLTTQGTVQEDIDKMPKVAAATAYYFNNLPTFLNTWTTLISAVTTIFGSKPAYQLPAEQLRRIQQPVQFLWGEKDPFGDLEVARQVSSLIPDCQLHEMEIGHLPFMDRPEESGRLISQFLPQETDIDPVPAPSPIEVGVYATSTAG